MNPKLIRMQAREKRGKSLTNILSDNLPPEDVVYDIPKEEIVCSCGGKLEEISRTKTKRLSIIPAQIKVINEYRITRACKNCNGIDYEYKNKPSIKTAVGKKHLIPSGIATASLITWSISEKLEYALPFCRQEKRFRYIGAEISRSNLCN